MAAGFDDHVKQLADAFGGGEVFAARARQFVERFVRPRGLDRPAAPVMADEIERVGTLRKPRRRTPAWHYPFRWALLAAATARFARP